MYKSRSQAQVAIASGLIRINGQRVENKNKTLAIGDIITFPRCENVIVLRVISLAQRRGPAAEAQACYQLL